MSRLAAQMQSSESSFFVTLTYDDEHLPFPDDWVYNHWSHLSLDPYLPCVYPPHITKFHKDLRKRLQQGFVICRTPPFVGQKVDLPHLGKMSFYLTSEYGPEGSRPHYHAVYFNLASDVYSAEVLIRETWKYGFVQVAECNMRTINYVTKYLIENKLQPQEIPGMVPPFARMSKGLGLSLLTPNLLDWWRSSPDNRCYVPEHGSKQKLSRYLKEKIFDDDMKARIQDKYKALHPARPMSFKELLRQQHLQEEYVRQRRNLLQKKSVLK